MLNVDDVLDKIVDVRNITDKEMWRNPKLFKYPTVPFSKLDLAVERLEQAIRDREWISIYGDFDCDGITATAVLYETLSNLGGWVNYILPNRVRHGHGLDKELLESLVARVDADNRPARGNTDVLLTCDCGTNDVDLMTHAWGLGMDVIVTDHHVQLAPLPDSSKIIVVNPAHLGADSPFRGLSGVGVAYLVARKLYYNASRMKDAENLLDLVALGTIADMVPMTPINRALLYRGLPLLWSGRRLFSRIFMDMEKIHPYRHSTEEISFILAPMINASGRLDDANLGVEFVLATGMAQAEVLALKLRSLNGERKHALTKMVYAIENSLTLDVATSRSAPVLIGFSPEYHAGLVGLACNRLAEIYNKPVILIAIDRENHVAKGSCRSPGNSHSIIDILMHCSQYFKKFGGHEHAGGFVMVPSKIKEFVRACTKYVDSLSLPAHVLEYDVELDWSDFEIDLAYDGIVHNLERLMPFGMGFEPPVFMSRNLYLSNINFTKDEKHGYYTFADANGTAHTLTWWNHLPDAVIDRDNTFQEYDVAFSVCKDWWVGQRPPLQARGKIVGIRRAEGSGT